MMFVSVSLTLTVPAYICCKANASVLVQRASGNMWLLPHLYIHTNNACFTLYLCMLLVVMSDCECSMEEMISTARCSGGPDKSHG